MKIPHFSRNSLAILRGQEFTKFSNVVMALRNIRLRTKSAAALLSAAILGFGFLPGARASESAAVTSPRVTATLIADAAAVTPGQTFQIGLRQKLAPRWHTYWKNPGDSGEPPSIKLDLPAGAKGGEIRWPGPDRIPVGPVMSFGYENEIVFPLAVTVPENLKPGERFSISADAEWLVCEKECIPETGSFRIELPVAQSPSAASADVQRAFAASESRVPIANPWKSTSVSAEKSLTLSLQGEGISAASVKEAYFFPDEWGVAAHAELQQLSIDGDRLNLVVPKGLSFDSAKPLSGVVAITDGGGQRRWFEISATASTATSGVFDALPLWQAALFAFLGGVILNLMPCVFPVLAIKATSVVRLSHGSLREIRLSGAYYTLGVMVAFLTLAAALLLLRSAGSAVGWGFQFQSPLFVAAMSWLLLAVGLNLSGVFEIGLGVTGTGHKLTHREGHLGSFFTGLLAVVVATPCTAPFMGAAIGTALSAPALVCLAIFVAMGLGLAAPYAMLGIFPRLARKLPKPGAWMVRLRQAMAFPMYASAAWLVWVLTRQAGDFGLMIALAGGVLVSLAAWAYGISQHGGRSFAAKGIAAVSIAVALVLLPQLNDASAPRADASADQKNYSDFSAARLSSLRQEGKPVFVNMTAAWCITCLVNERTTLSNDAVKEAFEKNGVTYLKGDWTNRDPEISAYLRNFNRDGLPFYAFYPPGGREPVILPPVLTEAIVLDELKRAVH